MISNIVVNYPDVESQFIPIHLTENKLLACTIDHILESQKHSLIHKGRASNIEGEDQDQIDARETVRRFAVLWGHTVPAEASSKISTGRRGSAMAVLSEVRRIARAQSILEPSLFLTLDVLDLPSEPAFECVQSWLRGLSSLDRVADISLCTLTVYRLLYDTCVQTS